MKNRRLALVVIATCLCSMAASTVAAEEAIAGSFARIAFLRPHDGDTVEFEAGYIRHLDWHRRNRDPWVWYGWTIWAGERQRWFVFGTFGHTADSLSRPVDPAADEVDNIANVTPHAQYPGNGVYEYLPALSRGNGKPSAQSRLELMTVDLLPGTEERFETVLGTQRAHLGYETLWYRLIAGGPLPRYVRLRPRPSLAALLDGPREQALPNEVSGLLARVTVEILVFRPTMTYGLLPETDSR